MTTGNYTQDMTRSVNYKVATETFISNIMPL